MDRRKIKKKILENIKNDDPYSYTESFRKYRLVMLKTRKYMNFGLLYHDKEYYLRIGDDVILDSYVEMLYYYYWK